MTNSKADSTDEDEAEATATKIITESADMIRKVVKNFPKSRAKARLALLKLGDEFELEAFYKSEKKQPTLMDVMKDSGFSAKFLASRNH